MKPLTIISLCAFSVYCGHEFTHRKTVKQIQKLEKEYQERIEKAEGKHATLQGLHREHIDKCRFNHYNK
jgi:L-fucose mutarotase/ribose pyranase (RbsD/FucU family)